MNREEGEEKSGRGGKEGNEIGEREGKGNEMREREEDIVT
jgi:hypothetical protein